MNWPIIFTLYAVAVIPTGLVIGLYYLVVWTDRRELHRIIDR